MRARRDREAFGVLYDRHALAVYPYLVATIAQQRPPTAAEIAASAKDAADEERLRNDPGRSNLNSLRDVATHL